MADNDMEKIETDVFSNFNDDLVVDEEKNIEMEGKYLTFWTDSQLYGVPIKDVLQIIEVQQIIPVPEYPSYAKGIINMRGSIIPVIDIRLRFQKTEIAYTERTCIIVTNIEDNVFGFIVDSVNEVATISDDNISMPPQMENGEVQHYICGIGKQDSSVVLLLDTQKIIGKEELAVITKE